MDGLILLILILIVVAFVVPVVAQAKASQALRAIEQLKERLRMLETRPQMSSQAVAAEVSRVITEPPPPAPIIPPAAVPPPLPTSAIPPIPSIEAAEQTRFEPTAPPPAVSARAARTKIDWEQFMGAKMFAWIGGLALFLGVAFFVKYSFEHNLVPPEMRVVLGFLAGVSLLTGGVLLKRKENVVTAQTLCATGILILYAVTFACRAFYHFSFFGLIPTFVLMALITAAAFLL